MIEIIKELKIEVSKPNIFQAVVAKQYDMNTRFIKATLVDGADVIYIPKDPDGSVKVVINAERPDGQSKGFDGSVNNDGTVTVPLHSWMLELEGTVICDISIIDTEADDNKKLTTTSFTLLVEKAAYGGGDVTNDPQYDVMVQLLETCSEASTVAQEALDKSNEANAKYEACVEATEKANQAKNEVDTALTELAEGGYIKSIEEQNKGELFSVWVGTEEEYKEVEGVVDNRLYLTTDEDIDEYFNTIEQNISNLAASVNERLWHKKIKIFHNRKKPSQSDVIDAWSQLPDGCAWSATIQCYDSTTNEYIYDIVAFGYKTYWHGYFLCMNHWNGHFWSCQVVKDETTNKPKIASETFASFWQQFDDLRNRVAALEAK